MNWAGQEEAPHVAATSERPKQLFPAALTQTLGRETKDFLDTPSLPFEGVYYGSKQEAAA